MITLIRGDDRVIVTPERGGSIVTWHRGERPVLRDPQPNGLGCFPMVPYCNRIARGRFVIAGESFDIGRNSAGHPHAIHGIGWQRAWHVETAMKDRATLSLDHDGGSGWPFPFSARMTWQLNDQGLTITMEANNRHDSDAPMGLGIHPWFPREAGDTIAFEADGVWINQDTVAHTHTPVPGAWDHRAGRAVSGEPLDNCFSGWPGLAQLPGLRMTASAIFGHLQVYTPAGAEFFCVEPVSHAPNAINRPGPGMAMLKSGESVMGSIDFVLERSGN